MCSPMFGSLANSPARMLNVSPQPMFENLAFGLLNCTGES